MRKSIALLGMGLLLAAANAMADDAPAAEEPAKEEKAPSIDVKVKTNTSGKYGPAGCGLGSLIFSPDSGFTQIFAATTNGTSANQTFAISSGTSNCDNGEENKESAKAFVETNRAALAKDISRGRGETLNGLAELAGCPDSRAMGSKLQKNFKRIFPTATVTDDVVGDSVVDVLKQDTSLACGNLG